MPIKPSRFKKLPKVVQQLIAGTHQKTRAQNLLRTARQHVKEVNQTRVNPKHGGGLPVSDARYFLLASNKAEFLHSKGSQKIAQAKASLAITRKGKLKALKDQRIERNRQKALIKVRQSSRKMKL